MAPTVAGGQRSRGGCGTSAVMVKVIVNCYGVIVINRGGMVDSHSPMLTAALAIYYLATSIYYHPMTIYHAMNALTEWLQRRQVGSDRGGGAEHQPRHRPPSKCSWCGKLLWGINRYVVTVNRYGVIVNSYGPMLAELVAVRTAK